MVHGGAERQRSYRRNPQVQGGGRNLILRMPPAPWDRVVWQPAIFFDQRKETNQALWMDMALARRSGQELRNSYIITNSPEYAPLRRFFKAAVDGLQLVFDRSLVTSVQPKSLLIQMREAVADCGDGSSDGSLMLLSPPHDIPEVTFPAGPLGIRRRGTKFPPLLFLVG